MNQRRDRITALRIDVGLIILHKLGRDKFASQLATNGVRPEIIDRVLNHPALRRPHMPRA